MNIEDQEEALQKTEQYLCPANRNHKLITLDKLLSHLHTCKEIKFPDKPRFIYYCQYYQGHCFVSEKERQLHEDICKWKNLPGREYDPNANKYSIIQPSGKPFQQTQKEQPQNQTQQQQRNYEYAKAKGIIKKKIPGEYIPPDSFEFNKDFKKVDELIKLQIQKNITDQNQNFIQFSLPNQNINVLSQNKQLEEFITKRMPYNQHFRNKKYYEDIYKNKIMHTFLRKQPPLLKYDLTKKIPNEIISFKVNFKDYLDYLTFEFDEYVEAKPRDKNKIQTETFIIVENKFVIFFIQIGKDFNEVFRENLNLNEYKAFFSNFIAFKFDRDQYLDGQLQQFFNPQIKSELTNKKQIQSENIFEEEIDFQQQKRIGELKAKLEIQRQKNQEERAQFKKNQKELQEIIEKKNTLTQKEINIEQQIKTLNAQINSYNSDIKQFQSALENQNQEKIKVIYEQKEKELNEFIEQLNKQILLNQDDQQQITEEVQAMQEEKQKLKNNVNRLQLTQQQLERQIAELRKQESSVPQQMTQSEFYTGTEFVFDISDKIKCHACKQRKINVVYLPCGDAVLCSICHERFEQSLPHICPICEKKIKRIYHFMWESEK